MHHGAQILTMFRFFRVQLVHHFRRIFKKPKKARSKIPKSLQRAIAELERVTDYRGRQSEPQDCAEGEW